MNNNRANTYNPDNLSDAQLWGLGVSSILTEMNGQRHDTLYQSGARTENVVTNLIHMMKRDWGIESREEYLDMLKWLSNEGHNHSYMQIQNHFNALSESSINALIDIYSHDTDKQSSFKIVKNYRHTLRVGGIGAWDDGRYVSICRWGATTGVLTEEESWEKIHRVALRVQNSYDSWYSFGLSYIAGRQYWRKDTSEFFAKDAMNMIKGLTGDPNSPWNLLDWNLDLSQNS
ncbi:DUF1266 domain-containing protein [Microbulbifer sp. CNSA002]|uniref:DUF1266 domain-containing protein n=1 Tax=unclassified Microbulbifer TaxID=2619833 RepID=UPI0039B5B1C1